MVGLMCACCDCCGDTFTYHFSFDNVFSPFIYDQSIIPHYDDGIVTRISIVPFRFSLTSDASSTPFMNYVYKDGVILDTPVGVTPFSLVNYLQQYSSYPFLKLYPGLYPFDTFSRLFSYFPDLIDTCVPVDLEFKSRIIDFVNSIDLTPFLSKDRRLYYEVPLYNYLRAFPYKFRFQMSCDVIHSDKSFFVAPDFGALDVSFISEVKNVNFSITII